MKDFLLNLSAMLMFVGFGLGILWILIPTN